MGVCEGRPTRHHGFPQQYRAASSGVSAKPQLRRNNKKYPECQQWQTAHSIQDEHNTISTLTIFFPAESYGAEIFFPAESYGAETLQDPEWFGPAPGAWVPEGFRRGWCWGTWAYFKGLFKGTEKGQDTRHFSDSPIWMHTQVPFVRSLPHAGRRHAFGGGSAERAAAGAAIPGRRERRAAPG